MKSAIVVDGVVTNVIERSGTYIPKEGSIVPVDGVACSIGDNYDAVYKVFTTPPITPESVPLAPTQFRAMLRYIESSGTILNLDANIRAIIAQIPDGLQKEFALERYQNASEYNFDDEFLQSVLVHLKLSTEQVDTIKSAWITASTLRSG